MSIHVQTAAAIRKELKQNFPNITFSVKSHIFTGGDSVGIHWTDGPTWDTVNKIVCKYEYGYFNGMIDCYDNNNMRDDIPQVKYVRVDRYMSKETEEKIIQQLITKYQFTREEINSPYIPRAYASGDTLIYKEFCKMTF